MTSDCTADIPPRTYVEARDIFRIHGEHDARCRPWLNASAYLSADLED
jgi:hypothetical protein